MQTAFTLLFASIGLALLTVMVFWLTKLLAARSRIPTNEPEPEAPVEDVKVWKNPEGL